MHVAIVACIMTDPTPDIIDGAAYRPIPQRKVNGVANRSIETC